MNHNIAGAEGDCGRTTPCFLRLRLHPDDLKAPGSEPVDVILLDINMPEMNGFAFLEAYELTDTNQHARAVVVMLTSSPDPHDQARAFSYASVRSYVVKPIDVAAAHRLTEVAEQAPPFQ